MGNVYNKQKKSTPKAKHPGEPHRWGKGAFGRKKCAKCGKRMPRSQMLKAAAMAAKAKEKQTHKH
jgi:ribosomal protein S26